MRKLKSIAIILAPVFIVLIIGCTSTNQGKFTIPGKVALTKEVLKDKIKGGWAGQTLGVTYGGPTEFRYNSRIIPDSVIIPWPESGYCKDWFDNRPGLYDDIYMDLTFVEVFEKYGLDAPVDSFATAFAYAAYPLWHANQAARYNIMNGIMPPHSGHWKYNPHADDIDFQIESDFAGLMSPGMPVTASEITDKIGHIMNYGDGWYGGVYVSAMYSLAFITDDIDFIVREALKMLPQESNFYKFMSDVIVWSEQYEDWKQTWEEIEAKWGDDMTCPQGYSDPFNIEATMNCAYILMGLLYGDGDMGKTVEISTRCGADSDCNPSNAAGILGTALGYSKIPDYWLNNVKEVEDRIFPFTSLSLNSTYELSMKHALELIERNGGGIKGEKVTIVCQRPSPVRYEKSFEGIVPVKKEKIDQRLNEKGYVYDFEGSGILVSAEYPGKRQSTGDYVAIVDVIIDGVRVEEVLFPADFIVRKLDLYWNFDLPEGKHKIELRVKNPDMKDVIDLKYVIVYSPVKL
ncbi:MAG: ADP-ribosylglycohydrolase family protein [Bacteroidales bacterium]|nr:ADP-ribosylglycohydrolase family protein [Bacteroidales bacterium]